MNKSRLRLIALIFFLFFANFAFIPNVNSANVIGSDVVSLFPIADAYVDESSPNTNYGGDTSLGIECNSYHRYSYIMFDLASLPPDAYIIDAELWLTITSCGGSGEWGVHVGIHYCSDDSWSETGITWNNKPIFASGSTASKSFSGILMVPATRGWNATVDVRTAFGVDKKLTEVIMFEEPATSWGHMTFNSREATVVKLEIEYTTQPIYTVEFESIQDTGATSNLGRLNFSSTVFTLPDDASVAAGSYEAEYTGGYTFLRWETEGGVTVLDPNAQKTNVTVAGSGKLRAVGSAQVIQYLYDGSYSGSYTFQSAGEMVAVRFTPLFSGKLEKACFYIARLSSSPPDTFKVHVMDENLNDIITPFSQAVSSTGWFEVDLSAYNVNVHKDFYIGVEWPNNYYPGIGEGGGNEKERSFDWNGTSWNAGSGYTNYMIRAIVESSTPLKQVGIITCTPAEEYVYGENVKVSGSITPVRVGVEVNITYFRPDSSTLTRKTSTNATGGYTDSFAPDKVGSWKVMASWAGDETYEGSQSYPEEFTVYNSTSSLYLSYFYPSTITIGSKVNCTGHIYPYRFATIDLQYSLNSGQTWTTFASVNTTSNGDYSYEWTPTQIGNYQVRASWKGDEVCASSTSLEYALFVEEAIPEFPIWVLPLLMVLTTFVAALQKTKPKLKGVFRFN